METILRERRQYNIDRDICRSENLVIDRLLARSLEMAEIYKEIAEKLTHNQQVQLWDALLSASTHWNPDNSRSLREDQKTLVSLNNDIASCARQLAELMERRDNLAETTGFSAYDDYSIAKWIKRAAEQNWHYRSHVKDQFESLVRRYDLKYWPTTVELVNAIADFADEAEVVATNDWTEELLASPKCSKSDYLRVILKAVDDFKEHGEHSHRLPSNFRFSDRAIATFINCSLNFTPDEMVTTEYVKRARQNIRERKEAQAQSY